MLLGPKNSVSEASCFVPLMEAGIHKKAEGNILANNPFRPDEFDSHSARCPAIFAETRAMFFTSNQEKVAEVLQI